MKYFITLILCLTPLLPALGKDTAEDLRWYTYIYGGKMFADNFVDVPERITSLKYHDSKLVAAGAGRELYHIGDYVTLEGEGQIAQHLGRVQNHTEFNVLMNFRWQKFPWDDFLNTSIAWGHGFSYATEIPSLEIADAGNSAHVLYYKSLEADAVLPGQEDWSIFTRIHHRSGIFGTINNVDGGSNAMAMGMKKRF